MTQIKVALKDRTDTELNWSTINPVLRLGMRANTIDSGSGFITKFKVGDGVHTWSETPYFGEATAGGTAELAPLAVSTTDTILANDAVFLNTDGTVSGLKSTGSLPAALKSHVTPYTSAGSAAAAYTSGQMAAAFNPNTGRVLTFQTYAGQPINSRGAALFDVNADGTLSAKTLLNYATYSSGIGMLNPGLAYHHVEDYYLLSGNGNVLSVFRETTDGTLSSTYAAGGSMPVANISDGSTSPSWIRPFYNAQTGEMYLVAYLDTTKKLVITSVIVTGNTIAIDTSQKQVFSDVYMSPFRNFSIVFDTVNQQFVLGVRSSDAKAVGARLIVRQTDGSWIMSGMTPIASAETLYDAISVDVGTDGTAVVQYTGNYSSITTATRAYGTYLGWGIFDTTGGVIANLYTHEYTPPVNPPERLSVSIDSSTRRILAAYGQNATIYPTLTVLSMEYDSQTYAIDHAAASSVTYTTFGTTMWVADSVWLKIPTIPGVRCLHTTHADSPGSGSVVMPYLTSFRDPVNDSNAQGFLGIAKTASSGGSVDIYRRGDVATLSGLTAGARYYLNRDTGAVGTSGSIYIGRALSATKLLLEF